MAKVADAWRQHGYINEGSDDRITVIGFKSGRLRIKFPIQRTALKSWD
ncbi:hypothetical protein [Azospira oryzae]|nr:hypothetical protein [Azospira oryzae]